MKEEKLIIIDGSSMLTTNYYGNMEYVMKMCKSEEERKKYYHTLLQTSDGKYTNAIYPMFKSIMKMIDQQKPTHMVFCFDKSRSELFRRKLYPEYKGNRGDKPEPLQEQFIAMEKILEELGFVVLYGNGFEADDYAGSVAKKFEQDIPTYLYTKDHDYLQLVSEYTKLWLSNVKVTDTLELFKKYNINKDTLNLPDKVFEYNPTYVKSEFGVMPEQIVDLKGLQGDTSDNIPGVYRLSSAAPILIEQYGTIENMYEIIKDYVGIPDAEKRLKTRWKELGIKSSPLNALMSDYDKRTGMSAKESALLSKQLATIKTDIPLDFSLDDLKININMDAYVNILNRYEFKDI